MAPHPDYEGLQVNQENEGLQVYNWDAPERVPVEYKVDGGLQSVRDDDKELVGNEEKEVVPRKAIFGARRRYLFVLLALLLLICVIVGAVVGTRAANRRLVST